MSVGDSRVVELWGDGEMTSSVITESLEVRASRARFQGKPLRCSDLDEGCCLLIWANVFAHAWVLGNMDKPASEV